VGGDCNTPLAAHARIADGRLALRALVTDVDARRVLADEISGSVDDAEALGQRLAERLLAAGAAALVGRAGGPP
jgi:hydroxymethylbilane synthase